jgi:hypothetical protein
MNYGQIRTHFLNLLNRNDCTNALADTFISQGINRAQRLLRTPLQEAQQQTTLSGTVTAIQVPNDLIQIISVSARGYTLKFLTPARYYEMQSYDSGTPMYWTRVGSQILLNPSAAAGDTVTINYYGEFAPFVDDTTETALSVVGSDMIIYGGLSFAADYFMDERQGQFETRFQNAIIELQSQAYDTEGPAQISPAYSFGDF